MRSEGHLFWKLMRDLLLYKSLCVLQIQYCVFFMCMLFFFLEMISHRTVGCHVCCGSDATLLFFFYTNNEELIWISHISLFYQWRCIWNLYEPSQSLRSSHSEQLLDLSLGLLGGTHRRRPISSCAGSVGATQHTLSRIFMFKMHYCLSKASKCFSWFCRLLLGDRKIRLILKWAPVLHHDIVLTNSYNVIPVVCVWLYFLCYTIKLPFFYVLMFVFGHITLLDPRFPEHKCGMTCSYRMQY